MSETLDPIVPEDAAANSTPAPATVTLPWRDPAEVAAAFADEPWTLALLSDGQGDRGRWSYLLRGPDETLVLTGGAPFPAIRRLLGPPCAVDPHGPPFQGGVAGLAGYDLGGRAERRRHPNWPNLALGRYTSLLAFDHHRRQVVAIGEAAAWLDARPRAPFWASLCAPPQAPDGDDYEAAVAEVVERIAAGEIFQANIARLWRGRLTSGARPYDLMLRLARRSPAPFAAYLRLPGLALVSNAPERFLKVTAAGGARLVETRPIKGTAPRGATPEADQAFVDQLQASQKDRAENLMIVDLMRNDVSRVCRPGSVKTPELCRVESFANVHHLVSTVTGELAEGRDSIDLLEAAFPPGSITGAPKIQAMKVIDGLEPPRGPFFGSMLWAGFDGSLDSSVLIRTAGFVQDSGGWRFEARAGAGIVADSDPIAERRETETKIAALLAALEATLPR